MYMYMLKIHRRVKVISRVEKSHDDLCILALIGVDSHNEENSEISFYRRASKFLDASARSFSFGTFSPRNKFQERQASLNFTPNILFFLKLIFRTN